MYRKQIIPEFEELVAQVFLMTHLHDQDRVDLEMELKQHLYDHHRELVDSGCSQEQSIIDTIDQFGEVDIVRKKIKRNYPNTLYEFFLKEIIIGLVLVLAIIIGPKLLNLQYFNNTSLRIIVFPLLILMFAIPFQNFILKRINAWQIAFVAICVIYLWYIVASFDNQGFSLNSMLRFVFSISLSNFINGYQGLFTFHTIHFFWFIILLMQFTNRDSRYKVWQLMIFSSFQYWGMICFGVFITSILHINSESSVIFVNIFFISSVLEQILIDPLIAFFNKLMFIDFDPLV